MGGGERDSDTGQRDGSGESCVLLVFCPVAALSRKMLVAGVCRAYDGGTWLASVSFLLDLRSREGALVVVCWTAGEVFVA